MPVLVYIVLHNQFQIHYSPAFFPLILVFLPWNVFQINLLPEKEKKIPELSIARSLTLQHESSLEDCRGQSFPRVLLTK